MSDRNVADLHPELQPWYLRLVADLAEIDIEARMIEGFRDPAYQQSLVDKHITTVCPAKDLHCFTLAGKPAAKAFDLGIFDAKGEYIADGANDGYIKAGALWRQYALSPDAAKGMVWGHDFVHAKPDPDHFQIA